MTVDLSGSQEEDNIKRLGEENQTQCDTYSDISLTTSETHLRAQWGCLGTGCPLT